MKFIRPIVMLILMMNVSIAHAQSRDCPAIVEETLANLDVICQSIGRNQMCYGNDALQAMPKPHVARFQFDTVGDIADVMALDVMRLSPMDEATGVWGVALMQLQADIPDTLPGQNVTFLLFGDVELANLASQDASPMQAFILSTGIGAPPCEQAPPDGLLVQTPAGVQQVSFNINGVDVQMGSTVFFQIVPDQAMQVTTIEGVASLTLDGKLFPIIAGTRINLPIDADFLPIAMPSLPDAYLLEEVISLPVSQLVRQITIMPPLDDDALRTLRQRLEQNLPPCDAEGLPLCDALSLNPQDWQRLARATDWLAPISVQMRDQLGAVRDQLQSLRQRLPDDFFRQRLRQDLESLRDNLESLRDDLEDTAEDLGGLRDDIQSLRDSLRPQAQDDEPTPEPTPEPAPTRTQAPSVSPQQDATRTPAPPPRPTTDDTGDSDDGDGNSRRGD